MLLAEPVEVKEEAPNEERMWARPGVARTEPDMFVPGNQGAARMAGRRMSVRGKQGVGARVTGWGAAALGIVLFRSLRQTE